MSKTALVIVDIQNDYFPNGRWPLVGIEAAAAHAAQVLAQARASDDLVVHIRHEAADAAAPFFVAGSEGAKVHPDVAEKPGEPVFVKHQINAFLGTGLDDLLKGHGVEQLTLVGAMSHMCIDAAARAGSDLGYKITVLSDACATHDLESAGVKTPAVQVQAAFMGALAFAYASVLPTGDYLKARKMPSGD